MKMKKIKILIMVACVAVLGGCTKWLEVEPVDRILEKSAFSNEVGANSVLNGVYRKMGSRDLYGYLMGAGTLDMLAHYYTFPFEDPYNNTGLGPMWDLGQYNYVGYDGTQAVFGAFIDPMWRTGYGLIMTLNNYIEKMSDPEINIMGDKRRDLYLGEAYGLRAMLHLDLLRTFGSHDMTASGLPYHDKNEVVLEPYEATGIAFLGEVMKDLDRAEALLRANDPIVLDQKVNDEGNDQNLTPEEIFATKFRNKRMNYWAVQALKARVHMLLGNYADVISITDRIIAEAVDEEYTALDQTYTPRKSKPFGWTPANNNWSTNAVMYDEVIFGVTQTEQMDIAQNVFKTTLTDNGNMRVMTNGTLFTDIFGAVAEGDNAPTIESVSQKDRRAAQYVSAPLQGVNEMGHELWISQKYTQQIEINAVFNRAGYLAWAVRNMKALIRLSEMVYLNAEAKLDQDDLVGAATTLNTLLARRGFQVGDGYSPTNLLPDTATAANIKDMLTREYYREFQGEGQVFFYLKRNGETSIIRGNNTGKRNVELAIYKLPLPVAETDFYTHQK
jgi:hypothetical protein